MPRSLPKPSRCAAHALPSDAPTSVKAADTHPSCHAYVLPGRLLGHMPLHSAPPPHACPLPASRPQAFHHFNAYSYFAYIHDLKDHPGPPFDISPLWLLASLLVAVVGAALPLACIAAPCFVAECR